MGGEEKEGVVHVWGEEGGRGTRLRGSALRSKKLFNRENRRKKKEKGLRNSLKGRTSPTRGRSEI